jgi:hypothetical protein
MDASKALAKFDSQMIKSSAHLPHLSQTRPENYLEKPSFQIKKIKTKVKNKWLTKDGTSTLTQTPGYRP